MSQAIAEALTIAIQYLGATPVLLFLTFIIVGPMLAVVWIVFKLLKIVASMRAIQEKQSAEQDQRMREVFARQDQRFEHVVQMYKDNVALVNNYEDYVRTQQNTNDKLIDLVTISTATQQTLVDYIKNNWWCPITKDTRLYPPKKES